MVSERTSLTRQPIATRGVEGYFDLSVCLHPRSLVCWVITSWNQQMEVSNNIVHAALMIWCKYFKVIFCLYYDIMIIVKVGRLNKFNLCEPVTHFVGYLSMFIWFFVCLSWTQNYKLKLWQALIDFIFKTLPWNFVAQFFFFLLYKHVYRIINNTFSRTRVLKVKDTSVHI